MEKEISISIAAFLFAVLILQIKNSLAIKKQNQKHKELNDKFTKWQIELHEKLFHIKPKNPTH